MPVKDINKNRFTEQYEMPRDLRTSPRRQEYARWKGNLWKPFPGHPQPAHFSVTGETRYPAGRDINSGGCLHELLREFDARGLLLERDKILVKLIRWHLFDVREGPMHYVANGVFWFCNHLRHVGVLPEAPESWLRKRPEDARALEHFKTTIVFGALDDDAIPEIPPMPRQPPSTDAYVYEPTEAKARDIAWRKACVKLVEDTLTPWLQGRLPRLMQLFEEDMAQWFGPEILEATSGAQPAPADKE